MQNNSIYNVIVKFRRTNLNLVEKLSHYLKNIQESSNYKYVYNSLKNKEVEICIEPTANEFLSFLKDQPDREGLRGLFLGNRFYFWNQYDLLHEQVARALHLPYKNITELIARSFELTNRNSIHQDHWDKIAELQGEMSKQEFLPFYAKCLNTLKALNRIYHTRIDDLEEYTKSLLDFYNSYEVDYNDFSYKTPQERHNIRKARYERNNKEINNLMKDFKW